VTAAPIDRDRELIALSRALDLSIAGLGSVVSIQGPAGIGKTTLLRWLGAEAAGRGCSVLETAFPLAAASRSALTWALGGLLDRTAAGPVVLLADDLHLAEPDLLDAIDRLADGIDGRQLLLAVTLRVQPPAGTAGALQSILSGPYADVLSPEPLDDRGVDALLHGVFGRACEAGFVTAAHNVSGGNPLLLQVIAEEARALGLRGAAADGLVLAELAARGIDAIMLGRGEPDRPAA
jgi:predicted ATPase